MTRRRGVSLSAVATLIAVAAAAAVWWRFKASEPALEARTRERLSPARRSSLAASLPPTA